MVEIYTEILGFTAPSSLSAGATVNVRVQVKNASGVTGHAVCYIDGNPFDPTRTYLTVGSGVAYLGPGASAWVDVTLWGAMPAWNFVLTARNYELTSQISRTIALGVTAIPTSATVTVRGKCTGGYPLPSMLLEIYDKEVKIKSETISVVSIGTVYIAQVVLTSTGLHRALGKMVLTSPLETHEFLTLAQEFVLG